MKKPQKVKNKNTSFVALAFEISGTQSEVQLLPDGVTTTDDARAIKLKIDADIAAGVIAKTDSRKRDTVIDYEHHTLLSEYTDVKAIAAGWFSKLEYRPGEGLFITDARWTDTAATHIDAKEYKYISGVFTYNNKNGAITRILHAGLTNDPAIDGLNELELQAAAKFNNQPEEESLMNEEQLALLGLKKDATEEEITAALKAQQTKADDSTQEVAALKASLKEAQANADGDSGKPDPSKYVPVEALEEIKTEFAALKASQGEKEVEEIVALAMQEGKILPAQEQWARDLGAKDVADLKAYVEASPAIAALKGSQTEEGDQQFDADGKAVLSEDQVAICKAMGMSVEDYAKTLAEEKNQAS